MKATATIRIIYIDYSLNHHLESSRFGRETETYDQKVERAKKECGKSLLGYSIIQGVYDKLTSQNERIGFLQSSGCVKTDEGIFWLLEHGYASYEPVKITNNDRRKGGKERIELVQSWVKRIDPEDLKKRAWEATQAMCGGSTEKE